MFGRMYAGYFNTGTKSWMLYHSVWSMLELSTVYSGGFTVETQ